MGLLKESDKHELGKAFDELSRPVRILLFTEKGDKGESEPNQVTRELIGEVAELSPQLTLEIKDLTADHELARTYGVDRTPAMVVMGDKDLGLRYFGVPAGHEFSGFVDNLIAVSRGEHGLPEKILAELAKVDQPVHLEVLFTPT